MKRIFIAIKITGNALLRKMISDLKGELRESSIKWTDPDNLHLTLSFLGDTEENIIPAISSMLDEKCNGSGNFDFFLSGLGVFKHIKDPKVIWAGIDKPEKLNTLQKKIMRGLSETGIETEDRQFSPHLTLGRIRHLSDREKLKVLLLKYHTSEIQDVKVDEVILYESILHREGAEYKGISIHKL
ncbi:MAG TPA: RNA 2',3'-cyclic phosphodiesterase [Bacteroidales bacterium]|jgi:2'-5' RNA ligase|nr:RNA 2',3'-cyclic phosphodiesterase [Bacteroidales bacterium]